jgi:hypothetical protein
LLGRRSKVFDFEDQATNRTEAMGLELCGVLCLSEGARMLFLIKTTDGEDVVVNTEFVENMRRASIADKLATAIKLRDQHQPLLAAVPLETVVELLGVISAVDG